MNVELIAPLIAAAVGLVVPWLTELVTHSTAPTWIKSVVTAVLAALVGAVTTVVVDPSGTLLDYLAVIGAAWLVSGRAYLAGLGGQPLSGVGIGAPQAPHASDS
ncbi:hypothetical protein LCD36_04415 [Saccharopolyspora sp. 6T]|uniref:hypothetical protein n=1 Tax=Saccharopolyspora sp. 6T TaxID=2877238 RepID=UPI001CD260A8|nr:hypothetical protein [Saccharopolyspora sp. 6T]MCA1185695.1 hypothetical protein [Saccharopolyspora sp. 6T]